MKSFKLVLIVFCALLAFSAQANALLIDGGSTLATLTGPETGVPQINAIVLPYITPATELYKSNVGGVEEGTLAGSYTTQYFATPDDPSGATITWDGPGIVGAVAWLLVKDGRQTPAWYLFNLSNLGWNGMDALTLQNFWPQNGAISHVSLYGGSVSVPEPATMLLLGLGLIGLAGYSRKRFNSN